MHTGKFEDFLDSNLDNFKERLQRILGRTPNIGGTNDEIFWAEFFGSMALSIQNTKLGETLGITKTLLSININEKFRKIVNLAFLKEHNNEKNVILRSILINKQDTKTQDVVLSNREIFESVSFSSLDKTAIQTQLAIDDTILPSKGLKNAYLLQLRIAKPNFIHNDRIQLINMHQQTTFNERSNKEYDKHMKLVILLRGAETNPDERLYFDTNLNYISNPELATKDKVKAFCKDLVALYNTNRNDGSIHPEAATQGFTYGILIFGYMRKYKLDTYVEHNAGRGRLDLEVIFRKMYDGQDGIINTEKGSWIIGEFKGDKSTAQQAIEQIKNEEYHYNRYRRTTSDRLIAIGLNFNQPNEDARIEVDMSSQPKRPERFISKIVFK